MTRAKGLSQLDRRPPPPQVGSDGTAETGRVNLLPEFKKGVKGSVPNVYIGVFTKRMSPLHVNEGALDRNDVVCRTVFRDLQKDTLGNVAGNYTRVYTVFFFESYAFENIFKFVVVSTLLLQVSLFYPAFEIDAIVSSLLAVVLTEVALLFTMPQEGVFSTAEAILVGHIIYEVSLTFSVAVPQTYNEHFLNQTRDAPERQAEMATIAWYNVVATLLTGLFLLVEYLRFKTLVRGIKRCFLTEHEFVGSYEAIDKQI